AFRSAPAALRVPPTHFGGSDVLVVVLVLVLVVLVLVDVLVVLVEVDVLDVLVVVKTVLDVGPMTVVLVVEVVVVLAAGPQVPLRPTPPPEHGVPGVENVQEVEQQPLALSQSSQTSILPLPHNPEHDGTLQLCCVWGGGTTLPVTIGGLVGSRYCRVLACV